MKKSIECLQSELLSEEKRLMELEREYESAVNCDVKLRPTMRSFSEMQHFGYEELFFNDSVALGQLIASISKDIGKCKKRILKIKDKIAEQSSRPKAFGEE